MYFSDVTNDQDEWTHLDIQVKDKNQSELRLYAGGQNRFKLASSNYVYFSGTIDQDYYGAWILYNQHQMVPIDMPILPITANIIQTAPAKNDDQWLSFWSKYFARSIYESRNSLFQTGKWKISSKLSMNKLLKAGLYSKKEASEVQQGFYDTSPLYLDWGANGNFTIVAMKSEPETNSSRVKRWRKEVRNDSCPPILVWFVSSLQAYVILDGHSRLKAFHCEKVSPGILVLESVIEQDRKPDLKTAESIMHNIETRQGHQWKSPMTVEAINKLLISVFDNRPIDWAISKSTAISGFEEEWIRDINQFKNHPEINQEVLKMMIFG